MDLRWILLILEILLVAMTISTTNAKKKKRTNSRPHVQHVSTKESVNALTRNADNSNTITNTIPSKQPIQFKPNIKNNKPKPKRTVKTIRRLIKKKKLIRNEKKRKRALKRLRKELAKLKRRARSHLKKCKTASDCGPKECCIKKFTLKGVGRCRKRPKLKQRCRPALLPGLDVECPCRLGLTCAPFKLSKRGYFKFRCEALKLPDSELEPQAITGLGRFK